MGYRRMDRHVLASIFRRWMSGHSINKIHQEEGFDRKTIREYIRLFEAKGYRPGQQIVEKDALDSAFAELLPKNSRARNKRDLLTPYREELIRLVNPDAQASGNEDPPPFL